jgi:hypothetical protein
MKRLKKIDWNDRATALLKREMKENGVTYSDLAERLAKVGVTTNRVTLINKINRGVFVTVFFLQALEAIGVSTLRLKGD